MQQTFLLLQGIWYCDFFILLSGWLALRCLMVDALRAKNQKYSEFIHCCCIIKADIKAHFCKKHRRLTVKAWAALSQTLVLVIFALTCAWWLGCIKSRLCWMQKWARSLLRRLCGGFCSLGWGKKPLQKSLLMRPWFIRRCHYFGMREVFVVVMDAGHWQILFCIWWRNAQWFIGCRLYHAYVWLSKCLCRFLFLLPLV